MTDDTDDRFHIVRNDEDQYSIWPHGLDIPGGWDVIGEPAARPECLARIRELWTDLRPLSLRR